jgi:hypothetical protein
LLLFRILGLLAVVAIATSGALFLVTRDRKYLGWTLRLARYTIAGALAFFGLLLLERLVVLV